MRPATDRQSLLLTAIVLTLNEERHIARCLASLRGVCDDVLVVDSGSNDRTVEIAQSFGAHVETNPWVNHAVQINWGIKHLADRPGWLLRIDADEVLTAETARRVRPLLAACGPDVDGFLVKRRMHFLGRRIRWGGVGGLWTLRLWRNGSGQCEQRWMDEHIIVEGGVVRSKIIIDDINLNSITWWTQKHNWYASLEAIETLLKGVSRADQSAHSQVKLSSQAAIKRWLKHAIYLRLPLGIRAALYFIYRYVLLLGFLDGREGYYFHYLQGYWYRTLVDAKINEIRTASRRDGISLSQAILDCTGIEIAANEASALDGLDAKKLMVRKA